MRVPTRPTIRKAFASVLIASTGLCFSSCSTEETIKHQDALTSSHQKVLERREIRQQARDERFRASREAVLN